MNIGILYPGSKVHATIGFEFLDGLKVFLKQRNLKESVKLFSESAGIGGAPKEVYEKAEKLLMVDEVDVLVAFIDQKVLDVLNPLFQASGKLVIIVNPGANYPQNWIPSDNVIFLNLQHSFLCWLTGTMAANGKETEGSYVSTYYDCGYQHSAAIVKAFNKAGGAINYNYINNDLYDDTFNIQPLNDFLAAHPLADNLLCVFDELPADLFYSKLKGFSFASRLQLFVSPMMLQDKALQNVQEGFPFSVNGYIPWHPSLENQANEHFKNIYQESAKKNVTGFSLLGWETGLVLAQVFDHSNGEYNDGEGIVAALKKISIESPRGLMQLDDATHFFLSPVIRCSIQKNTGKLEMESVTDYLNEWNSFVEEPSVGVISGWTNTYLCY